MLVHWHSTIQPSLRRSLELSMGMSDDYLQAVSVLVHLLILIIVVLLSQISAGSTNVRVGTAIFGPRQA